MTDKDNKVDSASVEELRRAASELSDVQAEFLAIRTLRDTWRKLRLAAEIEDARMFLEGARLGMQDKDY